MRRVSSSRSACLFAGLGLYGIAFGLLARSLISATAGLAALASYWFAKTTVREPFRWADSIEMWRDGGRFFVTSIAMRLQSQANILLVGTLLGPQVAAVYGLTVRAHETVSLVMSQLNSALGPVLAHLEGAGERTRLDGVIRTLLPVVAALAAGGAVCAVVLNESFVGLWVGSQAVRRLRASALMGLAMWVSAVAYVAYEACWRAAKFRSSRATFAAAAALPLLALLVPAAVRRVGGAAGARHFLGGVGRGVLATCIRQHANVQPLAPRLLLEPVAIAVTAITCGAALLMILPRANSWAALAVEAAVCVVTVGGGLLLARPPLRSLLRDELLTTLRSLRAA